MGNRTPDISRIRDLLEYNPETGVFMWKPKPAGHKRASGYISIHIDGVEIKAHRLAWFLVHGEWPQDRIDHINGDPSDNRISNLRDATARINAENQRRAKVTNQAKLLGVTWHAKRGKWQAEISTNGKKKYLGLFESAEEAHLAYLDAKRALHQGCTI
ncbi:HNH endonuclease [Burkholderia multivorans]|uniref:HNH endonuclease n=1 Tax=Burkholderia multivorans TaxID=87883 RepID=A0AB37B0Y0_9BURK|nr:HNH endonuclease [Burkholderia multivorans]MCO1367149.1 HNH endonuclease [Burkholderia multivorans]MCO1376758.1 HNH endonuclease [Burkholderia multivorans]PRE44113.1 HNH endonuclease [Burkholderia multivorans]PRE55584.1 HNH endonuclease [Burkholderia multivorans]UQP18705.1 HNH endonuclease [Burkholderia multivorans]